MANRFTTDVMLGGIAQIIVSIESLILLPFLTKYLGAAGYGMLAQITVTIMVLSMLAELGLTKSIIRFLAGKTDKNEISREFFAVFFFCLITGLIVSAFLFFFAEPFTALFLKNIFAASLFKIAAFLLLFNILVECMMAFFTAFRHIKSYLLLQATQTLGQITLIVYLLFKGYGLKEVVLAYLSVKLFIFLFSLLILKTKIQLRAPNLSALKPHLKFCIPIAPLALFSWIIHSSDIYFISFFYGAEKVGIYSVVYMFSKVIFLIMGPILLVLFPAVSKEWDDKNFKQVRVLLSYSIKYFLLFAIPATVGLIVMGKDILRILTSQAFVSGYVLFPFIATGLVIWKLADLLSIILLSTKNTKTIGKTYLIGAVANIALNFLLIPQYSILGAAAATILSYMLVFLMMLKSTYGFKFDWNLGFIAKSIFASIIMAFIVKLIPVATLIGLIASMVAGIFVYFVVILLIKGINKTELNSLFSFKH